MPFFWGLSSLSFLSSIARRSYIFSFLFFLFLAKVELRNSIWQRCPIECIVGQTRRANFPRRGGLPQYFYCLRPVSLFLFPADRKASYRQRHKSRRVVRSDRDHFIPRFARPGSRSSLDLGHGHFFLLFTQKSVQREASIRLRFSDILLSWDFGIAARHGRRPGLPRREVGMRMTIAYKTHV